MVNTCLSLIYLSCQVSDKHVFTISFDSSSFFQFLLFYCYLQLFAYRLNILKRNLTSDTRSEATECLTLLCLSILWVKILKITFYYKQQKFIKKCKSEHHLVRGEYTKEPPKKETRKRKERRRKKQIRIQANINY